ncbi:MAG: N-acetylglucosamine-6-phosphate deacetylase [Ezakiella sp.]|nr:N-acetylglucosamine-6-phosphate deacetylase [Ezakiella sp.]
MKYSNAKVFIDDKFKMTGFEVEDGKFKSFGDYKDGVDLNGKLVIPGLTDIHMHGAMKADACDGDVNSIKTIANYEMKVGVTQFCATTMTYNEDVLAPIFSSMKEYDNSAAILAGIHMEGPFIAEDKIGAQNPKYIQKPDIDMTLRLDELSGGLLKIISIAPEVEGAMDCAKAIGDKYIISIAHTNCDYDTAKLAYQNGFSHLTHMYNAMNGIHHRNPGPIPAALESGVSVELITDNVHINPAIVRMSFELFKDKLILVSDSMRATGLGDGIYDLGGQDVIIKGNRANLAEKGNIAGSVVNLFDCMKTAIKMGIAPEIAIRAASSNPARRIGIDENYGIIKEDRFANFLVLDEDYNLEEVYIKGELKCKN